MAKDDPKEVTRRMATAELARREKMAAQKIEAEEDFVAFIRMMWPVIEPETPLIAGWVLNLQADILMAATDEHLTRICVNVPPGTMKSTILNCLWPAWEWGPQNKPHMRYLSISYSTSVPERDNLRFARVIKHPVYRRCWGDRFDIVREGIELVENSSTGWKRVTSTGGGVTGWRGDRILCLPYETMIHTDVGPLPIGQIVEERLPVAILGMGNDGLRWQEIDGYSKSYSSEEAVRIAFEGGCLSPSAEHPIWTEERGWTDAAEVRVGDSLRVFDDAAAASSVERKIVTYVGREPPGIRAFYNLRVSPDHTYFANGVLTHNCDDLNNPSNVESDEVRQTTTRFVREIMPDRLNSMTKSVIINLQQRTHQNDATGTLIEHGQGYSYACVPMEFDPLRIGRMVLRRDDDGNPIEEWIDPRALDAKGRMLSGLTVNKRGEPEVIFGSPMAKAEGTSCWPERWTPETIDKLKREKGAFAFDSQYQQIPGIRGGSVIKRDWWKLWTGDYPEIGTVIISLDTAVEMNETNDFNACVALGAFADDRGAPQLLLLDAWKERMPLAELVARVNKTCRERKADYLLIEHKTRGRDVSDELVRLGLSQSYQTVLVKPQGDKMSRLKSVEHLFSGDAMRDPNSGIMSMLGGIIWAPDRTWAQEVIDEVASFPYGGHDDYVDGLSQALSWVRRNGVVVRKTEFEEMEEARKLYRPTPKMPYAIGSGR